MRKTFRYQFYPPPSFKTQFNKTLNTARWIWNELLSWVKENYERNKENVSSKFSLINRLTMLKKDPKFNSWSKEIYSQVAQNVCDRLAKAFQNFFRRVKNGEKPGYPRFKGKYRLSSITFPQGGFSLTSRDSENQRAILNITLAKGKSFELPKLIYHRDVQGIIKTLTIKKTSTNEFFAYFSCDNVEPRVFTNTGKVVGIDLGLKVFGTTDQGKVVLNPKFLKKTAKQLARLQRRKERLNKARSPKTQARLQRLQKELSDLIEGTEAYQQTLTKIREASKKLTKRMESSKACRKARISVAKAHTKVKNQRQDFHHKKALMLVRKYDLLAFEKLVPRNMVRNHCLARSILDASWGSFIEIVRSKVLETGNRALVLVDPKNTTQTCSGCGEIKRGENKLKLKDREYSCSKCGLVLDRDHNAAKNILVRGLRAA